MLGTLDLAGSEHWAPFNLISLEHIIMQPCENLFLIQTITGLLIFRGKKTKILRDFQGQIHGKIGRFRGISREKSLNSRKNRPISRDFRGRKVKIRRKIGRFRGILAEKSQILNDFLGQILRKIGRFHEKFRGETSPRNNQ